METSGVSGESTVLFPEPMQQSFRERLEALASEHETILEKCQRLEAAAAHPSAYFTREDSANQVHFDNEDKVLAAETPNANDTDGQSNGFNPDNLANMNNTKTSIMSRAPLFDERTTIEAFPLRACFAQGSTGIHVTVNSSIWKKVGRKDEFVSVWEEGHRHHRFRPIHPQTSFRATFDCCLFVMCIYDFFFVPYWLAWEPDLGNFPLVMQSIGLLFWAADCILTFLTGYYHDGVLVMDFTSIARRYLSSSFLVDSSLIASDVFMLFLEHGAGLPEEVWEIVGILRMSRLIRVLMFFQRFRKSLFKGDPTEMTLLGLVGRLVSSLLCMNHVMCCAWFWLGRRLQGLDTESTWLDIHLLRGEITYRDTTSAFQYTTSFHWAFTQLTAGSVAVMPQNSFERGFNVCCLVIGLFVSCLLISQLSAKMVHVQSINHERVCQLHLLLRFLEEQAVSRSLSLRIRRLIQKRMYATKPITMKDLPSLALLPTTLKNELDHSIFRPVLLKHTILYMWCSMQDSMVHEISARSAELRPFSPQDDVFVPHSSASTVYHVQAGRLTYTRTVFAAETVPLKHDAKVQRLKSNQELQTIEVGPQSWVSMVAMWCHWAYVGTLCAQETSRLVALDAEEILAIVQKYPGLLQVGREWAKAFQPLLRSSECMAYADLDIAAARVFIAMPLERRVALSKTILVSGVDGNQHGLLTAHGMVTERCERIIRELEDGSCVVNIGADGTLQRTVLMSVLQIGNSRGQTLYRIGSKKKADDTILPDVVLPSTKLENGETAEMAVFRTIRNDLPQLPGVMIIEGSSEEKQAQSMRSMQFGIRTCYLKTRFEVAYHDKAPRPRGLSSDSSPKSERSDHWSEEESSGDHAHHDSSSANGSNGQSNGHSVLSSSAAPRQQQLFQQLKALRPRSSSQARSSGRGSQKRDSGRSSTGGRRTVSTRGGGGGRRQSWMMQRGFTFNSAPPLVLPELNPLSIDLEDRIDYYSWLGQSDINILCSPAGKDALADWFEEYAYDEEMAAGSHNPASGFDEDGGSGASFASGVHEQDTSPIILSPSKRDVVPALDATQDEGQPIPQGPKSSVPIGLMAVTGPTVI